MRFAFSPKHLAPKHLAPKYFAPKPLASNRRATKRSVCLHVAAIAATGLIYAESAKAQTASVLLDNATPFLNNQPGANIAVSGNVSNAYEGDGYILPAGTTDITGFDFFPYNQTGLTLTDVEVVVYIWGAVNKGAVTAANPAFSDPIEAIAGSVSFASNTSAGLASGDIGLLGGNTASGAFFSGISIPLPTSTVGITINYEGSTDGGDTFSSMQNLTSVIPYGVPPAVGTSIFNGFYYSAANESNGNFITPVRSFQGSSGAALSNESGPMFRIYGDIASSAPDYWLNINGGNWENGAQWSNTTPPDGGTDAIFNLSSPSPGYTVEVNQADSANNLYIQNDRVTLDLGAQLSRLTVNKVLSIGQNTSGGVISASLNISNSQGVKIDLAEAGSIVVGSNGGIGKLNLTSGIYLYSDGDTAIGAGSAVVLGRGSKLGTDTLTIAGVSFGWTGQLDIGSSALDLRNGSIGTVSNQLHTGYNDGTWTGNGITSSAAHFDTTHLTAVGAIVNHDASGNQLYGSGTTLGLFDGDNPSSSDVLIRYTYYGDANLDGQVDGSDYSLIDNGFIKHLSGWFNGDFNYDGVVDGSDYTLMDNAFNNQASPLAANLALVRLQTSPNQITAWDNSILSPTMTANGTGEGMPLISPSASTTSQIASVPEPTALSLLGLGAIGLLRRRRSSLVRC